MADLFASPLVGQRVRVHLNLHAVKSGAPRWSVTVGGKVVEHTRSITLADVSFVVREGARQRVIAKRCREVHAWAVGTVVEGAPGAERVGISYSPYRAPTFTTRDGRAVVGCEYVEFAEAAVAVGQLHVEG